MGEKICVKIGFEPKLDGNSCGGGDSHGVINISSHGFPINRLCPVQCSITGFKRFVAVPDADPANLEASWRHFWGRERVRTPLLRSGSDQWGFAAFCHYGIFAESGQIGKLLLFYQQESKKF